MTYVPPRKLPDPAEGERRAELETERARLERALDEARAAHGPGSREAARAGADLAAVLQRLGDWPAVLDAARAVETACLGALGPADPATAVQVNNVGSLLRHLGRREEARERYLRALECARAAHGDAHPFVATVQSNVGAVLRELGRDGEARPWLERALETDRAAYPDDHPSVGRDHARLGALLDALGEGDEARRHLRRALEILTAARGDGHPEVAYVRTRLDALDGAG